MSRPLPPSLVEALEAEIDRRARERADQLCAERVAAGLYVEVLSPREIEIAAQYGLRPVGGRR